MLQDMIHPPEQQLSIEDISSPISSQMFEFSEQELFPETLQNSEVSSCSNCCYEDSSYTNFSSSFSSFPIEVGKYNINSINSTNSTSTISPATPTPNNLSIIFDSQDENDNDISASISFSPPSTTFLGPPLLGNQPDQQFDLSALQVQIPLTDVANGFSAYSPDPSVPVTGPPLPAIFEDDGLSLPLVHLDPSSPCSILDPTMGSFLPGNLSTAISSDASGLFGGSILMGSDLHPQELDFPGDSCDLYASNSLQRVYSSGDVQVLSPELIYTNFF
ncbi:PREDICTED: uncharacterized protein LOC104601028 [Nelumbo nucifera]|uniref:Uncharacterized protein LOC104601028 n=1 Tax=Nelumbo nucifera TaxID=4432 RepID=A0A1U8Q5M8_NELNU|nr:PREDICTED: uncharacterized protein LOC104601028 [Nelumbo nucifera]